jgi:hypothetical protein
MHLPELFITALGRVVHAQLPAWAGQGIKARCVVGGDVVGAGVVGVVMLFLVM